MDPVFPFALASIRLDAIPVVFVVFLFVYLMVRAGAREKEERRRLDLIDRALHSGNLDEHTKRELVEAVTAGRRPWGLAGFAWVGFFVGIGMIVIGFRESDWWEPGILTTAASFAVLSLPVAMREMRTREQAP